MGKFVYRCLAVSNAKRPFETRCKNVCKEQGVLCDDHIKSAQLGVVDVLMHKEVTESYGIQFKNQVTVKLSLKSDTKKPESKFSDDERKRVIKAKLFEDLRDKSIAEIKVIWKQLNLGKWNPDKESNEYKLHYFSSMSIINKLIQLS